jgi:methionine gamma-lyase
MSSDASVPIPTPARPLGFATRAIHHGYDPLDYHGALNPPLFLTSTYAFDKSSTGSARFAGEEPGYIYHRVGNPTVAILESRLAELEGGEAALATSSGMGAITSVFWTLLSAGDEIIADKTLYGCTFGLLHHHINKFGVTATFVDLSDPDALRAAITDRTRIVFAESPANPNMRIIDLAATAEIAHQHGAVFVVDNTYCTPYLQRPLEFGADIVVHSATKYLGGHGDLLAGAIVSTQAMINDFRYVGVKELTGAAISSFDAFLILRGMKTLELRMDRHCSNADHLAEALEQHPAVARVDYPGLVSFTQHDLAKRQMAQPGAMIALELHGGIDAGRTFMDAVQLVTRAVSLGDAETLVQHPATMTHATYSPEERLAHGFTDGLIRISVGLETYVDIHDDLMQALDTLRA